MKFIPKDFQKRLDSLILFIEKERKSPDPARRLEKFKEYSDQKTNEEERLFFIFLTSHFDCPETAELFFHQINWKAIKEGQKIHPACEVFFSEGAAVKIGDHRRNFRCMKNQDRVNYTEKVLESYRIAIEKIGSQHNYFEIDTHTEFDVLYRRMEEIEGFKTRLPRFDHLERVSRIFNCYTNPDSFYVTDSSGPRDGLTLLFTGSRFRKKAHEMRHYLQGAFISDWNNYCEGRYKIDSTMDWKAILKILEKWIIDNAKEMLQNNLEPDRMYVFDLESHLCNWQKEGNDA
nr:hypothetical protein [Candidatus Sigynarchaeum springense]